MSSSLVGLVAAVVLGGAAAVYAAPSSAPAASMPRAFTTTVQPAAPAISGAIRCENGDYTTINDSAHESYGIKWVTEYPTYIRITYDVAQATVGSMQITSDETYAAYKVVPGASVGLTYADVKIYKDGVLVNPADVCYPYSNFWVTAWAG